jgi:phytoene/squalene synthetase
MKNLILLSIIIVLTGLTALAQTDSFIVKQGEVNIYRDYRLDTLVQRVYEANEDKPAIDGYRIQIYSGSNRTTANQVKAAFMMEFREERAYLSYKQPYFKVRVGNYRTKVEALKLFTELKNHEKFKAVLIVNDEIDLPDLLEYPLDENKN